MNSFINNLERKIGKYAIPNLTMYIIALYVIGYVIQLTSNGLTAFLVLNPLLVLQGQVWRLVTWLLIPPSSFSILIIITLIFYYFVGSTMERTMGTFRYNLFIFSGVLFMIIAAFLSLGIFALTDPENLPVIMYYYSGSFTTYFVQQVVFLAFAIIYPEMSVLLMFIIPVKIKYLGILYAAFLGYECVISLIGGNYCLFLAITSQFVNLFLFWVSLGRAFKFQPKQVKRRAEYRKNAKIMPMGVTRHKCAVCGRTEQDDPGLEFRFCSKCNGNYEYCMDHLYTHQHVK